MIAVVVDVGLKFAGAYMEGGFKMQKKAGTDGVLVDEHVHVPTGIVAWKKKKLNQAKSVNCFALILLTPAFKCTR